MRYATAIRRLRQIAEDAQQVRLPGEDPLVAAIYTFGTILEAPAQLEVVDIALVADEPADELTWGAEPPWTVGVVERLRLDKAPVRWFFRPTVWPVWNHHIREPLRIYSATDGPDADALTALAHSDAEHLRLPAPSAAERQTTGDSKWTWNSTPLNNTCAPFTSATGTGTGAASTRASESTRRPTYGTPSGVSSTSTTPPNCPETERGSIS
jgi:hypothetical protein